MKGIQPVKTEWWGTGVVICLKWGANDLHTVQLMPLPPIISCLSKIQNGLPFWCWLTQVVHFSRTPTCDRQTHNYGIYWVSMASRGNKITTVAATLRGSQPGCNPHWSLWRHWWRHWWHHNSETIRDREKWRPPRPMKSSELSNGEKRIALRQLLQNRKWRHLWRHNLRSRWKL